MFKFGKLFKVEEEIVDERLEREENRINSQGYHIFTLLLSFKIIRGIMLDIDLSTIDTLMLIVMIVTMVRGVRAKTWTPFNFSKKGKVFFRVLPLTVGLLLMPISSYFRNGSLSRFDIIWIGIVVIFSILYSLYLNKKDIDEIG